MVITMKNSKKMNYLNIKILLLVFIFIIVSLISIYSSQKMLSSSYNNLYIKQLLWYLIGFICICIIYKSKNDFIYKYANILYIIGNILLLLVLFIGTESNGAKCWFTIPGIGSFQPSEFVKIFMILVLANLLEKYCKSVNKNFFKDEIKIILKCFLIVLIPSILSFLEPDTGIIFIYFAILIVMLFTSGIRIGWFIAFFAIITSVVTAFLILFFNNKDTFINIFGTNFFYRMDRIID